MVIRILQISKVFLFQTNYLHFDYQLVTFQNDRIIFNFNKTTLQKSAFNRNFDENIYK